MSLTLSEQVKKLLEDKKHILITFSPTAGGDAIASALALYLFLANQGKRADIVSHNFHLPRQFEFLKGSEAIAPSLSQVKTFIITLDVKETGVQELSYDLVSDKLRIFITPKQGIMNRDHVKTAESNFKYDCIITLASQDVRSLGAVYEQHSELFHDTPIINIDADSSNDHYGHINCIDITATSTTEVLFELLKQIGNEYIDTDVATALLTGMIAKTHSFKGENVKPHTLAVAGKLINLGANRDYIVENLYRTRTIAALRLWGEALSHLIIDKDLGLVSTSITRDDFVRSGAHKHDLVDIVDELITNSPEAKLILLFYEDQKEAGVVHVTLSATKGYNALELMNGFEKIGNKDRVTCLFKDTTLKATEELVKTNIVQEVAKRYT